MADAELVGTITGLTKASWGTAGVGTSALGVIYKTTLKKAGEDDKVFDGSGFTLGQVFFDDQDEITLEILALDTAALPARGDVLALTSPVESDLSAWKGVVQDAEKTWGYKEWKMIKASVTKFVNMTLPT